MAMGKYYDKTSVFEEAIRTLRTNIQFSNIDRNLRKILVSSSFPSEGKTTISFELSKSFAQTGAKVLLMDCDLRNPSIGKIAGITHNIGVTNLLLKRAELSQAILQSNENPNLHLLLCGPIPPNPAELLSSKVFEELVEELEKEFDIIIFDTPPVQIVTDAVILSTKLDGVVFVIKSGETKLEVVKDSLDRFKHVGGNVIGTVLTYAKLEGSAYGNKYYNKYYGKKGNE